MRKAIPTGLILGVVSVVFIMFGCRITPMDPEIFENQWPRIYLVNVPPDSSHLPHAPIVYWYGADSDGYIIAYQWAIDDTSTWATLWVDSGMGTEDTIAFSAPLPDTEFTHVFFVRAMDNDTAVTDPCCIGRRVFHVSNIPPVNTTIEEGPEDSATIFVISDTIATWPGVHFEWSTEDSDQVFAPQFSWKWDGGAWSTWDEAEEKYFTGNDDPALRTIGWHTFFLRARDDAMAIDTTQPRRAIYVSVPTLSKPLLVIDETANESGLPGLPNDPQVDDFYKLVLDNAGWQGFDTVDNSAESGLIHHDVIGQYRIVLVHSDDIRTQTIPEFATLRNYLEVGGRLFYSGKGVLLKFNELDTAFLGNFMGVDSNKVNQAPDFIGAIAYEPDSLYPYLEIDTTKILPQGAVRDVGAFYLTNVFNTLYTYDSRSDSVDFEGHGAVVFKFDHDADNDVTFRSGASSFPLYWLKVDASGDSLAVAMKKILDWLND